MKYNLFWAVFFASWDCVQHIESKQNLRHKEYIIYQFFWYRLYVLDNIFNFYYQKFLSFLSLKWIFVYKVASQMLYKRHMLAPSGNISSMTDIPSLAQKTQTTRLHLATLSRGYVELLWRPLVCARWSGFGVTPSAMRWILNWVLKNNQVLIVAYMSECSGSWKEMGQIPYLKILI